MTQPNQIYKCSICGNMTEVVHTGIGTLVCCGKNMDLMSDEVKPEGQEKHIPVINKNGNQITIKVGSVPHPMTPEHHIEWIEVIGKDVSGNVSIHRVSLDPTGQPEATFEIKDEIITVRAYCNLHGLRKS